MVLGQERMVTKRSQLHTMCMGNNKRGNWTSWEMREAKTQPNKEKKKSMQKLMT